MLYGKLLHTAGAAISNERSPSVVFDFIVIGISGRSPLLDRRLRTNQ